LTVFVSNKHIYAQIIDDAEGRTLVAARDADVKDKNEASSTLRSGYLLPTLHRERNPSEAKTSPLSSVGLRPGYFAKGDKTVATAQKVGEELAVRAVKLGVKQVVFDRGGRKYHGRIKALADSARAGGLEF